MENNKLTQTTTNYIKFDNDPEKLKWIDISIQNQTLVISDICELLAKEINSSLEAVRSKFYKTWKAKGFQEYWYLQYRNHFKKRATAKVYGKLDKLLDNARYIKDVVQAGEFLEGKQTPNVAVQINNTIEEKKEKYGI